jgi:hypothetical protein
MPLYHGLDQLLEHERALEVHIKDRLGARFSLNYDLLLYDVTPTYFEGEAKLNQSTPRRRPLVSHYRRVRRWNRTDFSGIDRLNHLSASPPEFPFAIMSKIRKFAIWMVVLAVLVYGLRFFLDRDASKVVLAATGFGLALAVYSILDLQEQRREKFAPHTIDRLLRATFTAITLVFVVEIAFTPAVTGPTIIEVPRIITEKEIVEVPKNVIEKEIVYVPTLTDELNALLRQGTWNKETVPNVIKRHFSKLDGQGPISLFPGGQRRHFVEFTIEGGIMMIHKIE